MQKPNCGTCGRANTSLSSFTKPTPLVPAWVEAAGTEESIGAEILGTIITVIAAIANVFKTKVVEENRNSVQNRVEWKRTNIPVSNGSQQPLQLRRAYGDQYQLITNLRIEISQLKTKLEQERGEKRISDYDFQKQIVQMQEQQDMALKALERRWRQRKQELELSFAEESLERLRAYTHRGFWHLFDRDVQKSNRHVLIVSPFVASERVELLEGIFREAIERGVKIIVLARLPKDDEEAAAHQALTALGVVVHYRERFHQKQVIIDDILWEGSLNALSHRWNQQEHMRRIDHPELLMRALRLHKLTTLLTPDSDKQTDNT